MLNEIATKIFGSRNERLVRRLRKKVQIINQLEESMQALSDEELKAKTETFRHRLQEGETLDGILPEAFAVVREASKRVLNLRHFDVQLIGGMVLHMGKIAEMRTGEGKTLVATLAVYLNALGGEGVHVVTVNDYLARRDGEMMGRLYGFLGLTTGIIVSGMDIADKQAAYRADITYGTNNEFGFDYLRTNMAHRVEDRIQRELHYAIVDEVDSVLIDEARTPLIISGPAESDEKLYRRLDQLVPQLSRQVEEEGPGDFSVDEKHRQIGLTEAGHEHVETLLRQEGLLLEGESLYDPKNIILFHHLNACLRAHHLYHKDVEYIVRDDEVIIVDEFTGRTMEGRRWSDGLHQAIEVKENVTVKNESQTLASITYQNFFRLYDKLAGMTGTADTEAYEFQQIYGLETVVIPTNLPVIRRDDTDLIFLNQNAKYQAIVDAIRACQEKGQPVLVGTASVENSELLSKLLQKENIKHNVLNAKQHEREAQIIVEAGRPGVVTIATNMAGRGTDIVLGGNLQAELDQLGSDASDEARQKVMDAWQERHNAVVEAGGLHVIGAERHESRRIDNQLRGRSGRQGDPGSSRFYVALDDNLVRIFAGERMAKMMEKMGMGEGEVIESKMVSKQIEGAQRKVEAYNFDARKNLLEYDDVANEQRKIIYAQRAMLMESEDISDMLEEMRKVVISEMVDAYASAEQLHQQWDIRGLEQAVLSNLGLVVDIDGQWLAENPDLSSQDLKDRLYERLIAINAEKEQLAGAEIVREVEKYVALQVVDQQWKIHINSLDMLRQGIWMRSRAQKDPKLEYKREAFALFSDLLGNIRRDVVRLLAILQFRQEEAPPAPAMQQKAPEEGMPAVNMKPQEHAQVPRVGRNQPCPCGSGRKYKHCHGKLS